jgi:hypothetical protein
LHHVRLCLLDTVKRLPFTDDTKRLLAVVGRLTTLVDALHGTLMPWGCPCGSSAPCGAKVASETLHAVMVDLQSFVVRSSSMVYF